MKAKYYISTPRGFAVADVDTMEGASMAGIMGNGDAVIMVTLDDKGRPTGRPVVSLIKGV